MIKRYLSKKRLTFESFSPLLHNKTGSRNSREWAIISGCQFSLITWRTTIFCTLRCRSGDLTSIPYAFYGHTTWVLYKLDSSWKSGVSFVNSYRKRGKIKNFNRIEASHITLFFLKFPNYAPISVKTYTTFGKNPIFTPKPIEQLPSIFVCVQIKNKTFYFIPMNKSCHKKMY